MLVIDCDPLGDNPHEHIFLDDWVFGGADGNDPRADPRYQPITWRYLDAELRECHVTQVPFCLDEALDYFTTVAGFKDSRPVYLTAKYPGAKQQLMPWKYNLANDTVRPT